MCHYLIPWNLFIVIYLLKTLVFNQPSSLQSTESSQKKEFFFFSKKTIREATIVCFPASTALAEDQVLSNDYNSVFHIPSIATIKMLNQSIQILLLPLQIRLEQSHLDKIILTVYILTGVLVSLVLYTATQKIKMLKHILRKQKETLKQQSQGQAIGHQQLPEHTASTQSNEKKLTLLLVEHQLKVSEWVTGLLSDHFNIVKTKDGTQALGLLETEQVHMIISDTAIPEMGSHQFLDYLKNTTEYRNIPLVILADQGEIKELLNTLLLGVDDYLVKPFTIEEFRITVKKSIDRLLEREKIALKETSEETVYDGQSLTLHSDRADHELLRQFESIIRRSMEKGPFHLGELSEKLCLSERQLRRKTKRITGLSPKKYQQEIQLQMARELLNDKACDNIKAVALSIGMTHVTRFSQMYLKRFGKHPYAYFTNIPGNDSEISFL